jgi:hypothetical protein
LTDFSNNAILTNILLGYRRHARALGITGSLAAFWFAGSPRIEDFCGPGAAAAADFLQKQQKQRDRCEEGPRVGASGSG